MEAADWTTELTFEEEAEFPLEWDEVVEVAVSDHRMLLFRDAEDQHPIPAITNLVPELAARPSAAMTNTDIQNILNF